MNISDGNKYKHFIDESFLAHSKIGGFKTFEFKEKQCANAWVFTEHNFLEEHEYIKRHFS